MLNKTYILKLSLSAVTRQLNENYPNYIRRTFNTRWYYTNDITWVYIISFRWFGISKRGLQVPAHFAKQITKISTPCRAKIRQSIVETKVSLSSGLKYYAKTDYLLDKEITKKPPEGGFFYGY